MGEVNECCCPWSGVGRRTFLVPRSSVRRSSVAWKEGLLLEKVLGYWRGSREYVGCVTALSKGTVVYGVLVPLVLRGCTAACPVALGFGLTEVRGLEKCTCLVVIVLSRLGTC
jgi:hypothetical protein